MPFSRALHLCISSLHPFILLFHPKVRPGTAFPRDFEATPLPPTIDHPHPPSSRSMRLFRHLHEYERAHESEQPMPHL